MMPTPWFICRYAKIFADAACCRHTLYHYLLPRGIVCFTIRRQMLLLLRYSSIIAADVLRCFISPMLFHFSRDADTIRRLLLIDAA